MYKETLSICYRWCDIKVDELFLTVDEAATKLNVNPETIRRRIRKGRLKANLTKGPYGDQYMIPARELTTQEAQVVTTPQLHPAVLEQLTQAITQAVDPLKEELKQQRELLDAIYKRQDERIIEAARHKRHGWWKFW